MDKVVNIGMVGAGFMGQLAHLMNLVEVKGCRVVALAEYRPELRRRVAARFEIPRTYATHTELLQDAEVEAVVVVTPRPHMGPVVLDCLAANKHVLSEKPMAGTVAQGEQLVACARAHGRHYAVGYMKRHDEGVQTAKRLLDDALATGALGPVLSARARCYMGDSFCRADGHVVTDERATYPNAGWSSAPEGMAPEAARLFAAFVNTYSHNTNLLRFLFGRTPRVAYAHMGRAAAQTAVLDFGDFSATLETGKVSNRGWDEVTEVMFAHGRLTLWTPPPMLRNVPARVELYRAGEVQELVAPITPWSWSFRRQAEAFVHDVAHGLPGLSPGADALEDLRLAEALWRADGARA